MFPFHLWFAAIVCVMLFGVSSCRSLENSEYLQRTAGAAHDHIMFVREAPPTFGFERLRALSEYYPDLSVFIQRKSLPRYYAETMNGGESYFILYYPEQRKAFACRSLAGSSRRVEFSGPYPITKNELATLRELEAGIDKDLKDGGYNPP